MTTPTTLLPTVIAVYLLRWPVSPTWQPLSPPPASWVSGEMSLYTHENYWKLRSHKPSTLEKRSFLVISWGDFIYRFQPTSFSRGIVLAYVLHTAQEDQASVQESFHCSFSRRHPISDLRKQNQPAISYFTYLPDKSWNKGTSICKIERHHTCMTKDCITFLSPSLKTQKQPSSEAPNLNSITRYATWSWNQPTDT